MADANVLLAAARDFADAVAAKSAPALPASAEDQLCGPFENLLAAVAAEFSIDGTCTGEPALPNRLGRPDYAVSVGGALAGYVELKAPGTGAEQRRFRGRNREQFKRFAAIPNILYGDGGEWALYRGGERVGGVVKLAGDVRAGANAVREDGARELGALLRKFLSWEPILPRDARGGIDLKAFAALLAPLARLLRDDVAEALGNGSALSLLAQDWRQLLFPDATDAQFADAYAQTVTFALLLGRAEGADPLTLEGAQETLAARHGLLSRALQVLTDPNARSDMAASLALLQRVLAVVPPALFDAVRDPWLYFYEDFLAAYDPALRKDAGVYYTPVEVVGAQVRLVDDLLANRLGKPLGFADEGVTTLDPAVGTGTYLLGIVEHALARVAETRGAGAVASHAATLAGNLHGFERLVGAYAVSELRVSRALQQRGAAGERANVYLTDTLESPHAAPRQLPLFMRPIAEQHRLALEVKRRTPMLVCLGNPPYDRHEAARRDNGHRTGAWVRWGEDGDGADAIFRDFAAPVVEAGRGGQLKNLYNLYVYFWRWALWKVFEQDAARGGVVSFVTASSYLAGEAFLGMREHMRRVCDEIWILDLGGEGRGARQNENVFAIQTPVAVAVAMRRGRANRDEPATVRYARIDGSRAEKLARLDGIRAFGDVAWQDCPEDWHAPFLPPGAGDYFSLPLLTDLMPWQHSGVQLKRTWPIAPDAETLARRWQGLLRARNRARLFRETRDRKVAGRYASALTGATAEAGETPLAELPADAATPPVSRYAYRSLDRQHVLADGRLMDFRRPDLWRVHDDRQVYLTTSLTQTLGAGPALMACADVPDLHHYSGRGAKDAIPLYRAAGGSEANVAPDLRERRGLPSIRLRPARPLRLRGALRRRAREPPAARTDHHGRRPVPRSPCRRPQAAEAAHLPPQIPRRGRSAQRAPRRRALHEGRAAGRGRLPGSVLPRRRRAKAARGRWRVRAGAGRRLRVRDLRPQGGAVLAALPHEARRRAPVLAAERHPAFPVAAGVHRRTAGAPVGGGRHAGALPGTGPAAGARGRRAVFAGDRDGARGRRAAASAEGGAEHAPAWHLAARCMADANVPLAAACRYT